MTISICVVIGRFQFLYLTAGLYRRFGVCRKSDGRDVVQLVHLFDDALIQPIAVAFLFLFPALFFDGELERTLRNQPGAYHLQKVVAEGGFWYVKAVFQALFIFGQFESCARARKNEVRIVIEQGTHVAFFQRFGKCAGFDVFHKAPHLLTGGVEHRRVAFYRAAFASVLRLLRPQLDRNYPFLLLLAHCLRYLMMYWGFRTRRRPRKGSYFPMF